MPSFSRRTKDARRRTCLPKMCTRCAGSIGFLVHDSYVREERFATALHLAFREGVVHGNPSTPRRSSTQRRYLLSEWAQTGAETDDAEDEPRPSRARESKSA